MNALSINRIEINVKDYNSNTIISCKEAKEIYKNIYKDINWRGMNEIIIPSAIENISLKAVISVVSLMHQRVPVCDLRCHFKVIANKKVSEKIRKAVLICA